jgi:hypothetical protein
MGYEEVTGQIESFTAKEDPIKSVEGLYLGSRTYHGTYEGDATESQVHKFDNNGEVVEVFGKGQLDYKLKSINVGTWLRCTHEGKEGRYHQFKVEVDKSRSEKITPEVAAVVQESDDEMPI